MKEYDALIVDNYDSFSYNLLEYVGEAGNSMNIDIETEIFLNDEISLKDVERADYDAVIISPGPGHPKNKRDVGITNDILREISPETPTLGVCMGLEAAVYTYGGTIGRAPEPIHGKSSEIRHNGEGIYSDIENPFEGARYHSLVAKEVPDEFNVTATTEQKGEELVMGVSHEDYPIVGVQFHPESILTGGSGRQNGYKIIGNFLEDNLDI